MANLAEGIEGSFLEGLGVFLGDPFPVDAAEAACGGAADAEGEVVEGGVY
jgi:hypothetical protein